ncbi:hypothetical protein GQ53DRAFT_761084 [Thozetella sp. PMI_491]|nr:hypothetical protein GQ53DRAFT_761084 [Thozetella sp. PMI_491]
MAMARSLPRLLAVLRHSLLVEIRAEIFRLVLQDVRDPPLEVDIEGQTSPLGAWPPSSRKSNTSAIDPAPKDPNLWTETKVTNPALSLLLVNRQCHVEVKAAVMRQAADYTLDVIIAKDRTLWPTWTSVPVLTRNVDTVYTKFRIIDLDDKQSPKRFHYPPGNGGPCPAVWFFYGLLTSFAKYGPLNTVRREKGVVGRFTMKRLIIDVCISPEGKDHSFTFEPGHPFAPGNWPDSWLRPANLHVRDMPSHCMARYLAGEIAALLLLDYYTMNYGMILYETILEVIDIRVNGELQMAFNMVELLAAQPGQKYWGETPQYIRMRKEKFPVWLDWLTERRRRALEGLPLNGDSPHTSIM